MTTKDFLEKTVWQLFLNYNAFVYPEYEIYTAAGIQRKRYTGFWPLNPYQVDFEEDPMGRMVVHFYFRNGTESNDIEFGCVEARRLSIC